MLTRSHPTTSQTPDFELLPAIDVVGGSVVRLRQGDFAQATIYDADPVAVAAAFIDAGAVWLHVVDLDGAREGKPAQLDAVKRVAAVAAGRASIELGGGLRTLDAVARALEAGVARVAIGTAALRNPSFAGELVAAYGADRVAVSIDVRDGLALGEGWRRGAAGLPAADAVRALADVGVATFEVTAIDRDGMLGGPDLAALATLVKLNRGRIIASGGIANAADVLATRGIGCAGVIVGKALYEGRVTIGDLVRGLSRGA